MVNCSFLLCQRWLTNVFPSLPILPISLPAFSTYIVPVQLPSCPRDSMPQPSISLYLPSIFPAQSGTNPSPLVQRAFRNHMNTVFALPAAITLEVVVFIGYSLISSSAFSKANVPVPELDLDLCPCIRWSM
ncbi:unnamed protein product [Ectocarpus fasciculatus]